MSAVLRAEGLTLRRAGRLAVDRVSLSLQAGQWVAIVGPNGGGKSTLLSLLAGLLDSDAGQVWLHGRALADWPAAGRARELSWLAQAGQTEGEIAVIDVVRLGRLPRHGLFGRPDAHDEAAVQRALAETETTALAARRVSELSGGERQRALLARALSTEARVLLLDEPTTHLDAPHQRALLRGLAARARDGVAVVTVLHDLTLALAADRILVMAGGRLVAEGAPADAALRQALIDVFDGAFDIVSVHTGAAGATGATGEAARWVAVPLA